MTRGVGQFVAGNNEVGFYNATSGAGQGVGGGAGAHTRSVVSFRGG